MEKKFIFDLCCQVYKAISIDIDAISTGSTKPCIMTVINDEGKLIGSYVVKVFNQNTIQQSQATNKEVYGNVLAQAFDLDVPNAALIRVDQNLITQLNSSPKYRNSQLIRGVYFGTKYIENPMDYADSVKIPNWELETVFAFDVLIRNVDRRTKKPNLFFKDGNLFLIDHELSLNTSQETFLNLFEEREKYWVFIDNPNTKQKHVFLDKLRELNRQNPVTFDTFDEYLRTLNVDILDDCKTTIGAIWK